MDKLFLAFQPLDQWHQDAFQLGPKKWHWEIYTQVYTQGIILKWKLFEFAHSQHLSTEAFFANKPKNFAYMCSSKKKSLKQKNYSNRGGGEYWKFDEFSSQMREPVIKSYAEKVIAHAGANGGICRWGFVKDWSTRLLKLHLYWKSLVTTSTTKGGTLKVHVNNRKLHPRFLTIQLAAQPFLPIQTQVFLLVWFPREKCASCINPGHPCPCPCPRTHPPSPPPFLDKDCTRSHPPNPHPVRPSCNRVHPSAPHVSKCKPGRNQKTSTRTQKIFN
jgi:hypothetical protein